MIAMVQGLKYIYLQVKSDPSMRTLKDSFRPLRENKSFTAEYNNEKEAEIS